MNEIITISLLLFILLVVTFAYFFIYMNQKKEEVVHKNEMDSVFKYMQNFEHRVTSMMRGVEDKMQSGEREMKRVVENQFKNSQDLMSGVTDKMSESERNNRRSMETQFQEANQLIKQITKELTEVKEGNKQVFSMTEQLSNLEKVLTNQKQRGNWGESSLELILSNVINGNYTMQYMFANGEAVDAIVRIKDKILPIDSKFSLDNYQRCIDAENDEDKKFYAEEFKKDLKLRITETAKYIRESEGTLPIAFMFIPSEAIYYDLLAGENSRIKVNTQKLIEYAQAERVFIVSPTSILAYLHLVLSGIKAFTIEEGAKQIQKKVEELSKHMTAYEVYYKKLGATLETTVNHYNAGYKELKKIDKDVYKITDGVVGGDMDVLALDKPKSE
jgi:DNA recombination protein RmuC